MTDLDPILVERLAVLLLTVPQLGINYTEARDAAEWMTSEAIKLGWELTLYPPEDEGGIR